MSGEMVIPDIEVVNGASEWSDRPREWVPLLDEAEGEPTGEYASPMMGVIPNADAARLVGRKRRAPPVVVVELARTS